MANPSLLHASKPRAYIWDGGWIGIGRSSGGTIVPPHAHHAIQITISLDEPIRFRAGEGDWLTCRGAVVLPDEVHSFDPAGAVAAMLFVDPESREGRWLRRSYGEPINEILPERLECCLPGLAIFQKTRLTAQQAAELVVSLVHNLCVGPPPARSIDRRISRALELIRRGDAARVPIEDVARKVFLSPSRFAHLFTEEVGVPFRRYLLWRKLSRAMLGIGRGKSLSAVAHDSGFSDSAHLTRTFYQMYGIAPSVMLGRGEFHEIPAPFQLEAVPDDSPMKVGG
jgi:AraC family transcriptional regulator